VEEDTAGSRRGDDAFCNITISTPLTNGRSGMWMDI